MNNYKIPAILVKWGDAIEKHDRRRDYYIDNASCPYCKFLVRREIHPRLLDCTQEIYFLNDKEACPHFFEGSEQLDYAIFLSPTYITCKFFACMPFNKGIIRHYIFWGPRYR